jgi:nucleotide-binding universal stress UspA family protein
MSWPPGSRVLLLAVVRSDVFLLADFFVPATAEIDKILQEEVDRAAIRLRVLVPLLEAAHLSVTTRVERGDARSTIVETAASEHCDLVVIGSHGRTGFRKLLLGSVAAYVVAHSACDVLVVKVAEPVRKETP